MPRHTRDSCVVVTSIGLGPHRRCEQIRSHPRAANVFVHTHVHTPQTNEPDPPHMPHMSPTQPHMQGKCRGGPSTGWISTAPFTPYTWAWVGLHSFARTFTAVTFDPDRVRTCRFVRLHARTLPDTIQSSPRCTEVGNASNRVRPKSASRRVVLRVLQYLTLGRSIN